LRVRLLEVAGCGGQVALGAGLRLAELADPLLGPFLREPVGRQLLLRIGVLRRGGGWQQQQDDRCGDPPA
jgi:hypothetical protein